MSKFLKISPSALIVLITILFTCKDHIPHWIFIWLFCITSFAWFSATMYGVLYTPREIANEAPHPLVEHVPIGVDRAQPSFVSSSRIRQLEPLEGARLEVMNYQVHTSYGRYITVQCDRIMYTRPYDELAVHLTFYRDRHLVLNLEASSIVTLCNDYTTIRFGIDNPVDSGIQELTSPPVRRIRSDGAGNASGMTRAETASTQP